MRPSRPLNLPLVCMIENRGKLQTSNTNVLNHPVMRFKPSYLSLCSKIVCKLCKCFVVQGSVKIYIVEYIKLATITNFEIVVKSL